MEQVKESFVRKIFKRYFLDAMSAMALGLFSSLIIGLIISQLSKLPFLGFLAPLTIVTAASSPVVGATIGCAIAYGLKAKPLVLFTSAVTGGIGYAAGGPVGAYIAAVVGAELGGLVAGKTKVDIVITPLLTLVAGGLAGQFAGPAVSGLMTGLGQVIVRATELSPFPMGIAVSVLIGLALTAPISSAALCIMLGLDGLAAGAATVGCCAQMVGFAVSSYRENGVSGLLSQGIGTSMLQFSNILKRPVLLIPPTLAGAILGPISTCVLKMTNVPTGAGMGTSGLVGQFGAYAAMTATQAPIPVLLQILVMHFLAPAALSLLFSELLRKAGWIRPGDLTLSA